MSTGILSEYEFQRYHRQIILPEIGLAGQAKLKAAKILVVGAGGLGCPILTYLTAAGVGTIKVADDDTVDRSNLHRQPLYFDADIGSEKVKPAVSRLSATNPAVELIPIAERVSTENIKCLLDGIDIVVDGSDNFATKYLLNDASVELGKTLVSGSIFGFEGQVTVFNAPQGAQRGPTYRCLFPEPPLAGLVPACAETGVLGVLPGVIGTLQAVEALKLILGIGQTLIGRLLVFDALSMSFREIAFERNEESARTTVIRSAAYYTELAVACGPTRTEQIQGISATELRRRLNSGKSVLLIDVRNPAEKEEFDLGGELIPAAAISAHADRIPRDQSVVLYCHSGQRSRQAVATLIREFGFKNLLTLEDGILGWQRQMESDGSH